MFSIAKKQEPRRKPALRKSIPVLIVNKDWHDLFAGKKPSKIQATERRLEALVKKYSQVKQEIKEDENLKKQLLDGILADMNSISEESTNQLEKKMETNTNLIQDLNDRMDADGDLLLDLPRQIDDCNKELIFQTAEVFYPKLIENLKEYQDLTEEINELRRRLRAKLERRVELEERNDAVYHRLHQIFGPELIDELDEFFVGRQMRRKIYDLKGQERGVEDSAFLADDDEDAQK